MRKAQSIMEIAIVIAAVGVVLLVMGGYVKRGLNGKLKDTADSALEGQYDPANGNYFQVSNESGYSKSVTRAERGNSTATGTNTNLTYLVTYQAAGPNQSVTYLDGTVDNGFTNSSVAPLNSTSIEHTEMSWQNMSAK